MAGRYRVRPAVAADLDAIMAIELRSFTDPWTGAAIASAMSTAGAIATVAESDRGIIGCMLGRAAAGEGEIHSVAVNPDERGRGIGSLLVADAIERFVAAGAGTVWLEVRESNAAARALYRQAGFTEAGRRRKYYRAPVEDALVLQLELG